MGPFIYGGAVEQLKGRAGMVNFIKVGAVIPAGFPLQGILFIQQVFRVAEQGGGLVGMHTAYHLRREHRLILQAENHFIQDQADLLRRNAYIAPGKRPGRTIAIVGPLPVGIDRIGREVHPAEALALVHLCPVLFGPQFPILADSHGEVAVTHLGKVEHAEIVIVGAQVDHHLLSGVGGFPGILGRLGAAQVAKGQRPVYQRNRSHQHGVHPLPVQARIIAQIQHIARLVRELNRFSQPHPPMRLLGLVFHHHPLSGPHGQQRTQYIDKGNQIVEPERIIVQMPHAGAQA